MDRQCPACNARQFELLFDNARDYLTGEIFQVWRCGRCGLGVTHPAPKALERYYPETYREYPWIISRMVRTLNGLQAGYWGRGCPIGSRALEVGCGHGAMLDKLKRRGWRIIASERSTGAARLARRAHRIPVFVGDLDALALRARFDLIILFHVLEHLREPVEVLRQCARLLAPGGKVVVALPNFESRQADYAKEAWFHLDVPRHLYHFTLPSLRAALRSAGLSVSRVTTVSFQHEPYGWIESFFNRIALRHKGDPNALTRRLILLNRSPRGWALLVVALLMAPALALSVLSWLSGRGTTILVEAKRN